MNKNVKGAIAVVIVGGAAFLAYSLYKAHSKKFTEGYNLATKEGMADFLVKKGLHKDRNGLIASFETEFLHAWATAFQAGSTSFTYKDKSYSTQGGKTL